MPIRLTSTLLLVAAVVRASVGLAGHYNAGSWYHEEDHPVHDLFRREGTNDGVTYATVGTLQWAAGFPPIEASTTDLPSVWVDALNAAVAAGRIPDIPASTIISNSENPSYPAGYDPESPNVCSSTYKCITSGDIWDAPPGIVALSFDDGPLPASTKLLQFLAEKKQKATHFFIGTNILANPEAFRTAFEDNEDDIAVHTWTHPYMTTKNNLEVLAELGWTMLLIHNSTGGRIPRFWRPPYGDSDMRVRAIAKEVFGLTTVIWNQDTNDWTLDQNPPGTTPQKIAEQMQGWLTGPKSPGLVILEHELSDLSVASFVDAYPRMVSNGWKVVSLAQVDGDGGYQNALDSDSPVALAQVAVAGVKPPLQVNASMSRKVPSPSVGAAHVTSSQSSASHGTSASASASPHANQKSGAEHFNAASFVLSGVATLVAAAASSLLF